MKEQKEDDLTCQDCCHQSNKPSRCTEGKNVRYVGRKNPMCLQFKRR